MKFSEFRNTAYYVECVESELGIGLESGQSGIIYNDCQYILNVEPQGQFDRTRFYVPLGSDDAYEADLVEAEIKLYEFLQEEHAV